jgi:hypothetical protein
MTDSVSPPREVVIFQICLLDLYDSILEACVWDEAKLNAMLKAFMSSVLALVRVQQSLGQEVTTSQKEWVRQYRAQLERWLEEHSAPAAERP